LKTINIPIVLDADGLFAIAGETRILKDRAAPTILTPHMGELSQLTGWDAKEIEKGKVQLALDCAAQWKSILLLKGYRSLVALPSGELFVNPTGNPGMATAGMGDVLAGLIAGFLAQGLPADKATVAGVYLHGLAGDRVAKQKGERGLIASDVAKAIPEVMKNM
ncbi:MAG: NAD(P)H-hydrate dehydratase, partial [Deltaproteobacteria bacterium]|nr:NAD(P)H-hydrate dehydratase [Deltaproteobacteria bacterium]